MARIDFEDRTYDLQELVAERSRQGFIYPWECGIMADFVNEQEEEAAPFSTFLIQSFIQLLTRVQCSEVLLNAVRTFGERLYHVFHEKAILRRTEIVKGMLVALSKSPSVSDIETQ